MLFDLPDWVARFALFVLGAVSVGVFARRQYEMPTDIFDSATPELISKTPVNLLTGSSAYVRGLIFYILIFEIAFFMLSFSSVLLSLALQAAQIADPDIVGFTEVAINSANETSAPISEAISNHLEADATIPLIVATLIITFANTPPFSEIEGLVRSLAHGASGIPRQIYSAIDKIERFEFVDPPKDASSSIRQAWSLATRSKESAKSAGLDESTTDAMCGHIARIFSLLPWMNGTLTLWSDRSKRNLGHVTLSVVPAADALRARLETAIENGNASEGDWEALANSSIAVSSNVGAAFALFSINNFGARPNHPAPIIGNLIEQIESVSENRSANTVIGTIIYGSISAFVFVSIVRFLSHSLILRESQAKPESSYNSFASYLLGEDWGMRAVFALQKSLVDVAYFSVLFGVAAITALSLRANRIENKSWRYYSGRSIHYSQYLILTMLTIFLVALPFLVVFSSILEMLPAVDLDNLAKSLETLREALQLSAIVSNLPFVLVLTPVVWTTLKFADLIDGEGIGYVSERNHFASYLFVLVFIIGIKLKFFQSEGVSSALVIASMLNEVFIPFFCLVCLLYWSAAIRRRQASC